MSASDMSEAELLAWSRHPDTIARMARISQEVADLRQREAEEAECALLEQERLEQERHVRQQEAERRAEQEAERERERARERAAAERERQARARFYGLQLRTVQYTRDGEHEAWRTSHRTKRLVHGIASSPTITSNRHSRSSAGCVIEFPIPLLCEHEHHGSIGEVISLRRSAREIYVVGALHDDNLAADYAWSLVEQGELKAFSVASLKGTSIIAGSVLGIKFYRSWKLGEISLCRSGANPDCHAEILSSRRKIP